MDTSGGELLNGRYRLEAELGRGGMGSVYRAHDTLLDRIVAVKLLRAPDQTGRERLLREAKAAAGLNHPNVVTVHDAGCSNGATFIVMEYVEGCSLDKRQPKGLPDILSIAAQVALALDHAHTHGIIHRDVKPENIMLAEEGVVKLMDFGLARPVASRITSKGMIVGSVFYIAPEQALGQPLDGRVDLYSLGVMLYELTTGKLPFTADDPMAIISQHIHAIAIPPSTYNPAIPAWLEALILRLIAKQPEARPAGASEVWAMLVHATDMQSIPTVSTDWPALDRVVQGRMVGRRSELGLARGLWTEVTRGGARVLRIVGEPGIGKTRFVRELASQAAVTGGQVLQAECYPDEGAPFGPLGKVLDRSVQLLTEEGSVIPTQVMADLIRLSPALAIRYPDVPPNPVTDPLIDQNRQSQSVAWLFAALSQVAPILLVVEDIHWADGGTLSLLRHQTHRDQAQNLRMLTVLTCRGDSRDGESLEGMLCELHREGLTSRVDLPRLTREETGEMLAVMFQREITPEFLTCVYEETDGNPFFIEELCKSLVEQGKLFHQSGQWERSVSIADLHIPPDLRATLRSRLAGLAEGTREVLRRASIIGRTFDWAVLKEVSDMEEGALIEAVEAAEQAQLIEEVCSSEEAVFSRCLRYTFRHALVHQILNEGVTGRRRQQLSERVASTLEQGNAQSLESLAPRLGQLYAEAGNSRKAADYLLVAGDQARVLFSYQQAIETYRRALPHLQACGAMDQAARTWMKLGLLHHTVLDFEGSRKAYREGFALWQHLAAEPHAVLTPAPHALRLSWADPLTLDPMLTSETQDMVIVFQLFSGLVEDTADMDIAPDVARTWDIRNGGREYIFRLRDDVLWSDGIPVTAGDFEFTWKRMMDPCAQSDVGFLLEDIVGAKAYHSGHVTTANDVGVRAVDDLTLVVELERPVGYFLSLAALLPPAPRHAVERFGAGWSRPDTIVTNGPFLLESWKQEERLALIRNPRYHGRCFGNLDRVELTLASDSTSLESLARYEAGLEDVAAVGPQDLEKVRYRHAGEYFTAPVAVTIFLCFDALHTPFDDPRVRQAFARALDKDSLAEDIYRGFVSPAQGGLVPPGVHGHSPDIGLSFDPDVARRLLAEAGFPERGAFPPIALGYPPLVGLDKVKYVCSQWREHLGVEVGLKEMVYSDFVKARAGDGPAVTWQGWTADIPSAESFLRFALRYYRVTVDQPYRSTMDKADECVDAGGRTELHRKADRSLMEQASVLPLMYGRRHLLLKPWVKSYPHSPLITHYWKDVILGPH